MSVPEGEWGEREFLVVTVDPGSFCFPPVWLGPKLVSGDGSDRGVCSEQQMQGRISLQSAMCGKSGPSELTL